MQDGGQAKALYTINEVRAITGLGRTKLYELMRSKQLKSVKVGRSRKVPATALNDWIAGLGTETPNRG